MRLWQHQHEISLIDLFRGVAGKGRDPLAGSQSRSRDQRAARVDQVNGGTSLIARIFKNKQQQLINTGQRNYKRGQNTREQFDLTTRAKKEPPDNYY